jgi:hypothetical protein
VANSRCELDRDFSRELEEVAVVATIHKLPSSKDHSAENRLKITHLYAELRNMQIVAVYTDRGGATSADRLTDGVPVHATSSFETIAMSLGSR